MQNSLRPLSFDKFIGQERIKQTVKVIVDSSIKRKKEFDHMLFYGLPGLGKTTLADIISSYSKRDIVHVQGPLLEKKADLLTTFASIKKGDILFIDEIHSMSKVIEELLYSAMEDGVIDVLIGPDGDQKIMRMKLPSFSLTSIFLWLNTFNIGFPAVPDGSPSSDEAIDNGCTGLPNT